MPPHIEASVPSLILRRPIEHPRSASSASHAQLLKKPRETPFRHPSDAAAAGQEPVWTTLVISIGFLAMLVGALRRHHASTRLRGDFYSATQLERRETGYRCHLNWNQSYTPRKTSTMCRYSPRGATPTSGRTPREPQERELRCASSD
jgi:hypothetical protein